MPTTGPAADHFDYLDSGEDDPASIPPEDPDLDEQTAEAVPVTDAPDPAGEIAAAYTEES